MPLAIHGLQNLHRALKHADRDIRLGIRRELREVAEPVKSDIQTLAGMRIRNIRTTGTKKDWSQMRVGVTQRLVYVAPKQRGVKLGNPRHRGQQFAELIRTRAMDPAEERNVPLVRRNLEQMLDTVATKFNRGVI